MAGERWQAVVYPRSVAIAQLAMPRMTVMYLGETDAIGIESETPVRVLPIGSLFGCLSRT